MKKQIMALAFYAAVSSPAAIVTFSDRIAFQPMVTGTTDYDFQVPTAPAAINSTIDNAVGLSTVGGAGAVSLQVYGSTQAIGGRTSLGELNNFLAILLTFATPVSAFGFDNLDLTGGTTEYAIVTVNFADATPSQTFTFTTPTAGAPQFFGLTSTSSLIASVQVYSGDTPTSLPGGRANLIDNLVVGSALTTPPPTGVPEMSSWMLAMTGAGMIAIGRRRFA